MIYPLICFAAATRFVRLFTVSSVPLVLRPQSGLTQSFSSSIFALIFVSAATISSTEGTRGL